MKEITQATEDKHIERHKERLAEEYSEAAKESMEAHNDLHGTLDDGLGETDLWIRMDQVFDDRVSSNGSQKGGGN